MAINEKKLETLKKIITFHTKVNEKLNNDKPNIELVAHDFGHFFLIVGRKTVLEFMTDDLRDSKFHVSEPKLLSFLRDEANNIVGDVHCIKVTSLDFSGVSSAASVFSSLKTDEVNVSKMFSSLNTDGAISLKDYS